MTAKQVVAKLHNTKPIPVACIKILKQLEQREVKNEAIIECLNDDSALTAKVLQACNSSHYGFNGSIVSAEQAVLVLGRDLVVPIVLTMSLRGTMTIPIPAYGFEANELWRHSLATAVVAETFANEPFFIGVEPSTAFAAGLLHDIGKVAFAQALEPGLLEAVRNEITKNGLSLIQAERAVLGTDHAEVGAYLVEEWNLPAQIVEAVANHHKPVVKPTVHLSALTCVSDSLVHLAGSSPGWDSYALKMDPDLCKALELTAEKVDLMLISARETFVRIERYINIA
jgi:putative nucleotidyltransferase with HDIG domain